MNRVQILNLFLINGTDLSESKCSQLSGARPVLGFYTLISRHNGMGHDSVPCRPLLSFHCFIVLRNDLKFDC